MIVDCVHHSPNPAKPGFGLCAIAATKNPSGGYCNKVCQVRQQFPPGKFTKHETAPDQTMSYLSPDVAQLASLERRGLGDDIELLAKAIGADRLAKAFEELTGLNCGCGWRKRLLNKLPSLMGRGE